MKESRNSYGIAFYVIQCAVSVGLLAAIPLFVDLRASFNSLSGLPISTLVLCWLLFGFGSMVLPALQTSISFVDPVSNPSMKDLIKINFIIRFYSMFMPPGITSVIRWNRYRALGICGGVSAGVMIVNRLTTVLVVAAFVSTFLIFTPGIPQFQWNGVLALSSFLVLAVLTSVLIFLSTPLVRRMSVRLEQISVPSETSARTLPQRMGQGVGRALDAMYRISFLRMSGIILAGLLGHLIIITGIWLLLLAFGEDIGIIEVGLIRSIVTLLLMLPISVAGLGVRELSFVTLFPLVGVSAEAALALGLCLLGFQITFALLGAGADIRYLMNKRTRSVSSGHSLR